jgi:small conductance mechanosensitive channel
MTWEFVAATAGKLVEAWIVRIAIGLVFAVITWQLAKWARSSFDRAATRTKADANARLLAGRLVYGAVWLVGLIWLLSFIGVDQAGILATFGAVGLALGLAVQDILKSVFAGLYLLFERPFLLGDEIEVKEHVGRVQEVGFRATTIRTEDNVVIVVPNAIIFAEVVANRSGKVIRSEPPAPSPESPGSPEP